MQLVDEFSCNSLPPKDKFLARQFCKIDMHLFRLLKTFESLRLEATEELNLRWHSPLVSKLKADFGTCIAGLEEISHQMAELNAVTNCFYCASISFAEEEKAAAEDERNCFPQDPYYGREKWSSDNKNSAKLQQRLEQIREALELSAGAQENLKDRFKNELRAMIEEEEKVFKDEEVHAKIITKEFIEIYGSKTIGFLALSKSFLINLYGIIRFAPKFSRCFPKLSTLRFGS